MLPQKQAKVPIFDKTDFLGLKYPPKVRVEPKTCSTICGTHKNSTEPAAEAREGQNTAQKCTKMVEEVLADTELSKINVAAAIEM